MFCFPLTAASLPGLLSPSIPAGNMLVEHGCVVSEAVPGVTGVPRKGSAHCPSTAWQLLSAEIHSTEALSIPQDPECSHSSTRQQCRVSSHTSRSGAVLRSQQETFLPINYWEHQRRTERTHLQGLEIPDQARDC